MHTYFCSPFFSLAHGPFPGGSAVKNPPANTGDAGLIYGLEGSPGVGNGIPLQYSCLGDPMDRKSWWTTISTQGCRDEVLIMIANIYQIFNRHCCTGQVFHTYYPTYILTQVLISVTVTVRGLRSSGVR